MLRQFHATVEGKIIIYLNMFFFLLWAVPALATVVLQPNIKLPGTLRYVRRHYIRIPCRDGRLYPYGFDIIIYVGNDRSLNGLVCRDFGHGWHWDFNVKQ